MAIPGMLLVFALLTGCGRATDSEVVTGQLRAGDLNYWLVGTTLVAIGGAEIGGEKSQIGSTVRAEGRRQPDGVLAATRIMVSAADPATPVASLPAATASGAVEAIDPATGRWQIAGQPVQLAPGVAAPGNIAVGERATAKGYRLPDGVLLAAEIVSDRPIPTATPTRPAPTPTTTQPPPAVPGQSSGPAPKPTEKPAKTKEPRNKPGNGNDDDGD
ncbi:MAG: DUF5666 domain-containing protein [Chloroflexia bacterium]